MPIIENLTATTKSDLKRKIEEYFRTYPPGRNFTKLDYMGENKGEWFAQVRRMKKG